MLASDSFGGRKPGTPGGQKTVEYLRDRFRELGLEPGNGDSWFQEVPLVSLTADPTMTLTVARDGEAEPFAYGSQFMAWTKRVVDRVDVIDSELVFAGYGIVAPEYGWNDYEGLDVEGKTVVLLVNDPGYATGDTALFNGNAMTYYGRWSYKYEEAARQGAEAALIVHETAPAGYPWEVVSGSWSGPQLDLVADDANLSRVKAEGWVTRESAERLFRMAGLEYDSLKRAAASRDFEATPMGVTASLRIENEIRRSNSRNVLARLPGRERPDELVVYMAHWDHLGRDTTLEGDQIYNGAHDNASGVAGLLELAQAFTAADPPPARSVLFLAVTAEEDGLLGSKHYAANPVYPLAKTAGALNLDAMKDLWGRTRDVTVVGRGMSELEDLLAEAATAQGRTLRPDSEPEKGFFYRSDHFEFAKRGVPALYIEGGIDFLEGGEAYGQRMRQEWTEERYHKPADELDPSWDLSGAVEDLRLLFRVGYRLAQSDGWPNWRDGTEFKAIRDSMMGAAGSPDG